MKTKVYGVRLTDEVVATYQEMSELMSVSLSAALREALEDAEPTMRELLVAVKLAKGGDRAGFLATMRGMTEAYQQALGGSVGEFTELQNEDKVKHARKKAVAEVGS